MQLKEAERKARTRRLIQSGGLVVKAGLLELEPNAFYGAVLSLRDRDDDAEQIREWAALGGRAFTREARAEDEAKEPVVISFPAPVARGVAAALRGAGLRFKACARNGKVAPISTKPRPSQTTTAAQSARSGQRLWQLPLNRYGWRLPSRQVEACEYEICRMSLSLSLRAAKLKRQRRLGATSSNSITEEIAMAMQLGHVHIKTRDDPQKVAQFYIDNFGATRETRNSRSRLPARLARRATQRDDHQPRPEPRAERRHRAHRDRDRRLCRRTSRT